MTFIQLKTTTVDSWNAASQLGLVAICLQGLIHPSWCRSSSITVCLTLCSIWPPWKLLPQVTMFHPSRSNSLRVWLKQMLHWTHQCLSRQNDWIHWWLSLPSDCCFVCFFCWIVNSLLSLVVDSWVLTVLKKGSLFRGCYQGCHHHHQWTLVDTECWSRTLEIKRKFRTWGIWVGFLASKKRGVDFCFFFSWLIFVAIHVDIHPGRKANSVNVHRVVTILLRCLSHSFVLAQHEPWGHN